jgi:hypothetical protein
MNGRYVTVPVRNHENPQGLTAALAAFPAGLSAKDPRADVRELLTKLVPDWAGVAPPSKVMKSRRRMSRPPARGTAYRIVEQGIVVRHSKSRPREGRYGSGAPILPCQLSRPLSTTPDITTFDREPSAGRRPAYDLPNNGHDSRSSCVRPSVDAAMRDARSSIKESA